MVASISAICTPAATPHRAATSRPLSAVSIIVPSSSAQPSAPSAGSAEHESRRTAWSVYSRYLRCEWCRQNDERWLTLPPVRIASASIVNSNGCKMLHRLQRYISAAVTRVMLDTRRHLPACRPDAALASARTSASAATVASFMLSTCMAVELADPEEVE